MGNFIKDVSAISEDLGPDWRRVPGFCSVAAVDFVENKIKPNGNSIGLVLFVNKKNAEVKLFIAKYTDKDARNLLS